MAHQYIKRVENTGEKDVNVHVETFQISIVVGTSTRPTESFTPESYEPEAERAIGELRGVEIV